MTKHDEFDDFFGDDDDTPVVDTRADGRLLRVPLGRLAPNGVNPRTDFGTEAELIDLGKSLRRRQIQACPAVSRSAYLKLWPDHANQIGDVDYVLVTGERRYRGAKAAENQALNCVVDDGLAKDRKTFMEAVVSENVDRQNFNPIEEAYAVQALVAEFGSNRAVAQHFERVDGWVTHRILLTHLAPEVQDLVRRKAMPLDAARSLGRLARDNKWDRTEQLAWWQDEQKQRAAASAERSAAKKAAKRAAAPKRLTAEPPADSEQQDDEPFYGRKTAPADPAPVPPAAAEQEPPADAQQEDAPAVPGQASPPEATAGEVGQHPKRFPYEDGVDAAHHLIHKMPTDEFNKMLDLLNKHRERQAVPATHPI
ncbi:ParB/RepB/Spo0J family partition protein [Streptomyces durbertensis]|uniref:ParB/RepB/Spo0J family partition protein n=1 Tax=Streptomyces durbertensis TaxID=2448886 RepID=A0ABR6EI73_9ACTN|nr:ParB/RepB/Spo0J family partition protein [Streptomyces durbertensis]MBB1245007.1 ParB/RepB/Spo0J family partition protein [Streptomyces durbertensis]